jgi:DNA polymerase-4
VTAAKLHSRGIRSVGHVAALGEPALVAMLGRAAGRHIHALAQNRDPRPVRVGRRRRSIGSQRALGTRPRPFAEIDATLVAIVDRLGRRLRAADRVCRTVVLRLRFADFSRATRSYTMPQSTARTQAILETARELLAAATPMIRQEGLTLIGISLTNLTDATPFQLVFPFDDRVDTALDAALDEVRDRFGATSVTRGVLLGRDRGFEVPLLPD